MKKREQAMKIQSKFLGWFLVSSLVSVACLPQASNLFGIKEKVVQIGLSVDANSNLQNMVIASDPNTQVRLCTAGTTAQSCFGGQGIIPLAPKGTVDGVSIHAIEDAQTLQILPQKTMELYVGTLNAQNQIDAAALKSFKVTVEATSAAAKITPAPVVLPAASQQSVPQGTAPQGTTPQGQAGPQGTIPQTGPQGTIPQQAQGMPTSQLANVDFTSNGTVQKTIPVVEMTNGQPKIVQMVTSAAAQFNQMYNSVTVEGTQTTCAQANGVIVFVQPNGVACLPRR